MKHKKWFFGFVVILLAIVVAISFNNKNNQPTTAIPQPNKNSEVAKFFDKDKLVVIGDSALDVKMLGLQVISKKIGDVIPERVRFVLIDDKLTIDASGQAYLKKLIADKHTVLFTGKNVDKKKALEKLGVALDDSMVQSDVTIYYPLFGYGYSFAYNKNMALFLGSANTGIESSQIGSFLLDEFTAF
jgi:hypothetical protein